MRYAVIDSASSAPIGRVCRHSRLFIVMRTSTTLAERVFKETVSRFLIKPALIHDVLLGALLHLVHLATIGRSVVVADRDGGFANSLTEIGINNGFNHLRYLFPVRSVKRVVGHW